MQSQSIVVMNAQNRSKSKYFTFARLLGIVVLAFASLANIASANVILYSGAAGGTLTTGGNWTGGNVPGASDIAQWSGTYSGTFGIGTGLTVQGVQLTGATPSVTIGVNGASVLSLGSSGIQFSPTSGNATFDVSCPITLTADQTWDFSSSASQVRMNVKGALDTGNYNVGINGTGGTRVFSIYANTTLGANTTVGSGIGSFWVQSGTTTINGVNNTYASLGLFSGTVNAASMGIINGASSIGKGSANLRGGTTLNYTGNTFASDKGFTRDTTGSDSTVNVTTAGQTLSMSGNLTSTSVSAGWTFGGAGNLTLSGIINDATSTTVTKTGTGTLTLSGVNIYTGNTTNSAGTLTIGGAGQLGSGTYAGSISNGAVFNYASSANQTLSGVISGTGSLTKAGTGTLTVSGANIYSGTTTVNAGTLQADLSVNPTGVFSSSSALTMGGGTLNIKGKSSGTSATALGNLTLNPGNSTISITPNGGSGTTLTLGNTWTANPGGYLLIDLSAAGTGTLASSPTLTGGIIGGYALVKDVNGIGFATVSGGNVVRFTGATYLTTAVATGNLGSTTDYVETNTVTLSGSLATQTLNSLEITNSCQLWLGTKTLVVGSGGILFHGPGFCSISGNSGCQITSGGSVLNVYAGTAGDQQQIYCPIVDNGGTKVGLELSGVGNLFMTGANTYSGDTVVNSGNLKGATPNIPYGAGKGNLVVNSGGYFDIDRAQLSGPRWVLVQALV